MDPSNLLERFAEHGLEMTRRSILQIPRKPKRQWGKFHLLVRCLRSAEARPRQLFGSPTSSGDSTAQSSTVYSL